MKNPKSKFLVSLCVGGVTALIFWGTLMNAKKEVQAQITMTPVLQAKRFIKSGERLTKEMVRLVEIPMAGLQPTALQGPSALLDKAGAPHLKARIGILKGEQVTKSKLFDNKEFLGLSWTLEPGRSALTLRLKPEQAVAGLIQPGDWVHVFSTIDKQPGWPKPKTHLLLNRVQVAAINERMAGPLSSVEDQIITKSMVNESMLVTLNLSLEEAAKATLAAKKGTLTLALVSPLGAPSERPVSVGLDALR